MIAEAQEYNQPDVQTGPKSRDYILNTEDQTWVDQRMRQLMEEDAFNIGKSLQPDLEPVNIDEYTKKTSILVRERGKMKDGKPFDQQLINQLDAELKKPERDSEVLEAQFDRLKYDVSQDPALQQEYEGRAIKDLEAYKKTEEYILGQIEKNTRAKQIAREARFAQEQQDARAREDALKGARKRVEAQAEKSPLEQPSPFNIPESSPEPASSEDKWKNVNIEVVKPSDNKGFLGKLLDRFSK